MEDVMNYVVGQVQDIFFENPTTYYKVINVDIVETNTALDDRTTVVGQFGHIQIGETYRFYGQVVVHPKYGEQLQIAHYEKEKPSTVDSMVAYLSSDHFPGIGERTAQKVVDALGMQAIEQINEDDHCLDGITGLNEKKKHILIEGVRANYGMEQIIIRLQELGFSNQMAFAIYQTYHDDALDIIQQQPYQLVRDIKHLSFNQVDTIAEQQGVVANHPSRIEAATLEALSYHSFNSGDTYMMLRELMIVTKQLLEAARPEEVAFSHIGDVISDMVIHQRLKHDGQRVFLPYLMDAEATIATCIQRLIEQEVQEDDDQTWEQRFEAIEDRLDIHYDDIQKQAIRQAMSSSFFVLTGGPGTGKTTIIKGIVEAYADKHHCSLDPSKYDKDEHFPFYLAAPTGRAAKRMAETTGLPAVTIHRLLGLGIDDDAFEDVSDTSLHDGILIVDEFSMVDTQLAALLFEAIEQHMQVVIVGDHHQLPSIRPGQVLLDLLQASHIPMCQLSHIYRQSDHSTIVTLSNEVCQGMFTSAFTQNKPDRSFVPSDEAHLMKHMEQIITAAKDKGYAPQDIQVLAPMYKGKAGIDQLNITLQELFNPKQPKKREVKHTKGVYRVGDKVLHLVNDAECNVFNGDIGVITSIIYADEIEDNTDSLVIDFDGVEVTYGRNDWQRITLAYCCSIHKSQGSEFPVVILPMIHQYSRRLLQRHLLYTGMTRSKEKLILIGEISSFKFCIENAGQQRHTGLSKRLLADDDVDSHDEQKTYHLTIEAISQCTIDPMIGMGDMTPFKIMAQQNNE